MRGRPPRPSPGAPSLSQPYLFRLFGTKRELFIATMSLMHQRIEAGISLRRPTASRASRRSPPWARPTMSCSASATSCSSSSTPTRPRTTRRSAVAAREGFRHLWAVVGPAHRAPRGVGPALFRPGDAHERPRRLRRRRARRVLGPGVPARPRALLRQPPDLPRVVTPCPPPEPNCPTEGSNHSLLAQELAMATTASTPVRPHRIPPPPAGPLVRLPDGPSSSPRWPCSWRRSTTWS